LTPTPPALALQGRVELPLIKLASGSALHAKQSRFLYNAGVNFQCWRQLPVLASTSSVGVNFQCWCQLPVDTLKPFPSPSVLFPNFFFNMKTGIIGAGIGGLATAIRRAAKGDEVEVWEANPYPGGKLAEIREKGYRFDAGPSLFTMPHYVDELFRLAGRKAEDHFRYQRLDQICNYFWEDGTRLTAHADTEAFAREVEEKLGIPADGLEKALAESHRKYKLTGKIFLENSLHQWKTWLSRDVLKALVKIPTLDIFTSMHKANKRLVKHPKLVQFLDRFATYNGSNPYRASGMLNILPHFEQGFGAYYPEGGMYQIPQSLYKLAQELGVTFHFSKKVEEIVLENGKAKALKIEGEEHAYDRIVSNMDVFFTYKKLLPKVKGPAQTLKQEKSTSALIFYWGIKKSFPELDLHNILFSQDYQNEFDHLSRGTICDDPTVYINISSKCDPGDTPPGCENWFTMINVPYDSGQDWDALIQEARKNIINKINRILETDVEALIETESLLEPRTIQSKTASHLGALYGTASNARMAAFLRHPNFSSRIKNLYFCGGSVHPGGGIPLSLLSAKIVDEMIG
jgi:phytoene desaturase